MNNAAKILAAALLALSAPIAFAGTGSEGRFQIYNNTASNTVVGFYTNDGNGGPPTG
jgi:hypothetical protein